MAGGAELRELRRRIRSIRSTQKITRAMELVAASRIARARQAVEAARPYAEAINRVIGHLSAERTVSQHPLLAHSGEEAATGLVVVASDRGLAGAYNANVLRVADEAAQATDDAGRSVARYLIGRKAEAHYHFRRVEPTAVWTDVTDRPTYADAKPVADRVMADYRDGHLDRVDICYTIFRNALSQVATSTRILPIDPEDLPQESEGYAAETEFEPEPGEILARLLPRYVEHRVFAAMLEASASEHAARQRAMKAATDNADDIADQLTREANSARQAAITTEISEITGGAEALAE